jgi:hypothetical protein
MKGHVSWVNELAVKEGKREIFRELMEEMGLRRSGRGSPRDPRPPRRHLPLRLGRLLAALAEW